LIVFETYRLRGHYEGDPQVYRPKGEADEWWKKDPLPRYQKILMEMDILTEGDVSRIDKEVMAEVEEAAKIGLEVPFRTIEDYKKTVIGAL
jgi:pyruvate dehydrogenase E1 component alpha subunit